MLKTPSREASIVLIWLVVATIFLYADHTIQMNWGPHGGKYKEVRPYYIELRKESQTLYTYLLDSDKKSLLNTGMHCDGQLSYPDGSSQLIKFVPYKEDGFIAQAVSNTYTTCLISIHLKDRVIQAIFENEQLFANKKSDEKKRNKKASRDSD